MRTRSILALSALILTLTLTGAYCSKKTTTNTNTAGGTQQSANAVVISNFSFSPAKLTVVKGTTVVWTNQDSAPHTVTGTGGGPASGTLNQGESYSYTFDQAGSFGYRCSIHPSMTGTVTVTE